MVREFTGLVKYNPRFFIFKLWQAVRMSLLKRFGSSAKSWIFFRKSVANQLWTFTKIELKFRYSERLPQLLLHCITWSHGLSLSVCGWFLQWF